MPWVFTYNGWSGADSPEYDDMVKAAVLSATKVSVGGGWVFRVRV